jgi:hypothetical protein
LVNHSLFQNCPPLFSVLLLPFPFPKPIFFRSSSPNLNSDFPVCRVPSDLRTVRSLHRSSSCILKLGPSHLSFLFVLP